MGLRSYAGAAKRTTLSADITSSQLTFSVVDATGFPTGTNGPFAVAVSVGQAAEEKILCDTRTGKTFTVNASGRGYDATAAAAHPSGGSVDHVLTSVDISESNTHVNATTGVHGTTGALVDTTTAQTLTNKTLSTGTVLPATVVDTTTAQTLSSKTLTTPTISSFTNATHTHTNAAGGGALASVAKTYRLVHTFTISGTVAVPSGATNYIPPFFVSLPAGQTAVIAGARHRIRGGTSATWTISRGTVDAGTAVTGLTSIASTTTVTTTSATAANTLADGDAVQLVVSAVSGAPENMTVAVFLDVTV